MRTVALAAVLLAIAPIFAHAQRYPMLVPEGWSLAPGSGNLNNRFVSPDGQASLTASTTRVHRGQLTRDMNAIAFHAGERVTYQRRGRSWIAVSGFRGNRIFYRKSNVACGGAAWHNIELEYPAADKKHMDAIVTQIAHGMTMYNERCRGPRAS